MDVVFGEDAPRLHLYFHFDKPVEGGDSYGHYSLLIPASSDQKGALKLLETVLGQHPVPNVRFFFPPQRVEL